MRTGYLVAFGGGILSFLSPCVLPIVPVVLSVVTGTDLTTTKEARGRLGPVVRDTLLFIAGFTAMFVIIGLSATAAGRAITHDKVLLTRVAGVVVIVMALVLAGTLVTRFTPLGREFRMRLPDVSRLGPFAAPIAGVAFGVAWTPCVTPILASVLAVAAAGGDEGHACLLLALYAAGLGVPCLAVSVAFNRLTAAFGFARRNATAITAVATVAMGAFGLLLVSDSFSLLTTNLQRI